MNCKHCGAPLGKEDSKCSYCGSDVVLPKKAAEVSSSGSGSNKKKAYENTKRLKHVSSVFLIYLFTLGSYSAFWYGLRLKSLNQLSDKVKLDPLTPLLYLLSFAAMFVLPDYMPELAEETYSYVMAVPFCLSVWLAFRVRSILQDYASNYMNKSTVVEVVAPSAFMTFCFGALYLQLQINKMIKIELLEPLI